MYYILTSDRLNYYEAIKSVQGTPCRDLSLLSIEALTSVTMIEITIPPMSQFWVASEHQTPICIQLSEQGSATISLNQSSDLEHFIQSEANRFQEPHLRVAGKFNIKVTDPQFTV